MDNMDNSNQQNNDLNNAYASYRREKNKNKSKFGKGLVAGILAGVLATVSVVGITAGFLREKDIFILVQMERCMCSRLQLMIQME